MRDLLNTLKILTLVLLVPVIPFLFFGGHLEAWLAHWKGAPPSAATSAAVVVGLLATDILLPIPSSIISTLAGSQLGVLGGTAAVWLGMTIGASLGFAIARRWGRAVALRFTQEQDLEHMEKLASSYGATVLVLFRAVPILAEASVLLVGIHKLTWRRFLPPVVLSNLGIALTYAKFGDLADRNQWLPVALGISVALPLLLTVVVRRRLLAVGKSAEDSEAAEQ